MKFQCNLKPLQDALALGIVNNNVSKYYAKSVIAQLTASRDELRINLEASYVLSEITLRGSGDSDEESYALVDNLLFKNLVSTFEEDIVTIEFFDGGITLYSGKSKFDIPNIVDSSDVMLDRPVAVSDFSSSFDLEKDSWKFIKDNQMYAIAMSFSRPVYTKVWVGENGDVIVGDMDNSIFTHSTKSNLNNTCLLSDTVINMLESLPADTKLVPYSKGYVLNVNTDGYKMIVQFTPQYEDDDTIGSYNSDIIMGMLKIPDDDVAGLVEISKISKFLYQADMLSSGTQDVISVEVKDNIFNLNNSSVECNIPMEGNCPDFSLSFKISMLKDVIEHYDSDMLSVYPAIKGDNEVVGILTWNDEMTTVLAGVED